MSNVVRTQISLEEDEMTRLKALAHARGVSIASLVRAAVEQLLDAESTSKRQRALDAVGGFAWRGSGEDHDRDVADAIVA
jgi:hypothetical protein